jgi:hypothetical protein
MTNLLVRKAARSHHSALFQSLIKAQTWPMLVLLYQFSRYAVAVKQAAAASPAVRLRPDFSADTSNGLATGATGNTKDCGSSAPRPHPNDILATQDSRSITDISFYENTQASARFR